MRDEERAVIEAAKEWAHYASTPLVELRSEPEKALYRATAILREANELAMQRTGDDPDDPILPGIDRAEIRVLCEKHSLIDLCRVVLAKAAGIGGGGLSMQGATTLDMETLGCTLRLRLLRRKRVKPRG